METPKEVRAWVKQDTLVCRHGTVYSDHFANGLVPIRILPYPPDDPPPEWPEGTKLRNKRHPSVKVEVGAGDIYRDNEGRWRFQTSDGTTYGCWAWEPVPTTESVTLRLTGSPERIACIRDAPPWPGSMAGITVEVVDDDTVAPLNERIP
jgi:hypothetical protein